MAIKHFSVLILSILNQISAAPTPQDQSASLNVNSGITSVRQPGNSAGSTNFGFSGYMPQITIIYTGLDPANPLRFKIPGDLFKPIESINVDAEDGSPIFHINTPIVPQIPPIPSILLTTPASSTSLLSPLSPATLTSSTTPTPLPESTTEMEIPIQITGGTIQADPISGTMSVGIQSGPISSTFPSSEPLTNLGTATIPTQGQVELKNKEPTVQQILPGGRIISPTYNSPWKPAQESYSQWPIQRSRMPWPTLNPSSRPNNDNFNPNSRPTNDNFNTWSAQNNPSNLQNRNLLNNPTPMATYETSFSDLSSFGTNTAFGAPIVSPIGRPYNSASSFESSIPTNANPSNPFGMSGRWRGF